MCAVGWVWPWAAHVLCLTVGDISYLGCLFGLEVAHLMLRCRYVTRTCATLFKLSLQALAQDLLSDLVSRRKQILLRVLVSAQHAHDILQIITWHVKTKQKTLTLKALITICTTKCSVFHALPYRMLSHVSRKVQTPRPSIVHTYIYLYTYTCIMCTYVYLYIYI